MWQGKKKAITFSFDDAVTQDVRLIEILDKYGLKATFNLNSSLLGLPGKLGRAGQEVDHNKIMPSQLKEIYKNHEVAVHTLTHPRLPELCDEAVTYQVEEDRKKLSELCGYEVVGMAYPCGGVNNDDRVAEVIKNTTGVKYARTITSTFAFDLQEGNRFRFNPSVYILDQEIDEVIDKFLALETDEPQLLYIWGHAYELDFSAMTWERFDALCKKLSGKADIFYGTNKEVLL